MKKVIPLLLVLSFQSALALECTRPIKKIFTGYTESTSKIHVEHGDGYSASIVRLPYVNNDEKIVDRILSVLLAAHLSGKSVSFRYIEDTSGGEASCTNFTNQIIEAVWIN